MKWLYRLQRPTDAFCGFDDRMQRKLKNFFWGKLLKTRHLTLSSVSLQNMCNSIAEHNYANWAREHSYITSDKFANFWKDSPPRNDVRFFDETCYPHASQWQPTIFPLPLSTVASSLPLLLVKNCSRVNNRMIAKIIHDHQQTSVYMRLVTQQS